MTEVFGVGPVAAATVIGDVRDVSRFADRGHFAAYNGTAPVEVSSGDRIVYRLSLRGNRRLNHSIHMAAITQVRCRHSAGRAYYEKKLAEGGANSPKRCAPSNARSATPSTSTSRQALFRLARGPGGHPGNDSAASAGRLTSHTPALGPSQWPRAFILITEEPGLSADQVRRSNRTTR